MFSAENAVVMSAVVIFCAENAAVKIFCAESAVVIFCAENAVVIFCAENAVVISRLSPENSRIFYSGKFSHWLPNCVL